MARLNSKADGKFEYISQIGSILVIVYWTLPLDFFHKYKVRIDFGHARG